MPETTLGLIPAQIAPFVVRRIGLTQARRLALLGNKINGIEAVKVGIAHERFSTEQELDELLLKRLRQSIAVRPERMQNQGFDFGC